MLFAAERAGLKYIVNVVLGEDKRVIFATAGEPRAAHKKGMKALEECVTAISGVLSMEEL